MTQQAAGIEVAVGTGHPEDLSPAARGGGARAAAHREDVRDELPLLTVTATTP